MVGLAVVEVEPAEDQALLLGVEIGHLRGGAVHHRVALDQSGDGAAARPPVTLAFERFRLRPHLLEPRVDPVDDLLFGGDLLRSAFGHDAPPGSVLNWLRRAYGRF